MMLIKMFSISLVLTILIFFNGCSNNETNKTPKCSDLGVINTLSEILSTDNLKAIIDINTVRKKLDLSEQNGKRTCRVKVDYIYNVDKNGSLIDLDTANESKNNQIIYTVISSETGKKYIVNLIKE